MLAKRELGVLAPTRVRGRDAPCRAARACARGQAMRARGRRHARGAARRAQRLMSKYNVCILSILL